MNADRAFSIVALIACIAALGWRFSTSMRVAFTPPIEDPQPVAIVEPGLVINRTTNVGIPMARVWSDYALSPSLIPWATQRSKVDAGC